MVKVQLVVFCYKSIHVDLNESDGNRRVCVWSQSITSESLTVKMTQQMEIRAIVKATEVARGSI